MGVRVSRIQRGEAVTVATPEVRLALGDVVHVVGGHDAIARAGLLVGPPVPGGTGPDTRRDQVDFRRILVSDPAVVGRRLGELGLAERFGAVATRLRRGDTDFVPADHTVVERGDRLRVVARPEALPRVATYLGDSLRALGETDFLSLSLGLLAGIAVGSLHVPLPGGYGFSLGLAGGTLLVALSLGAAGRTGPVDWHIPATANAAFRQLGLVLFFAAAGLRAGAHFLDAVTAHGPRLLAVGAAVTLASTVVLLVGARRLLRTDWVTATGVLAGGQTQPALLAFAGERAGSEAPNDAYVAVMPAAMLAKIGLAQVLLLALAGR
jgi:putative transport protein